MSSSSVRDSVQTLILSALQSSEASSTEAANAINSIIEAEQSLLPEIITQLRNNNQITEEVFQTLQQLQQQQSEEENGNDSSTNNNQQQQDLNENLAREFERIESENRQKLKQYYEERISTLENENGELYSSLVAERSKVKINIDNNDENNNETSSSSSPTFAQLVAQIQSTKNQVDDLLEKGDRAKALTAAADNDGEKDGGSAVNEDDASSSTKLVLSGRNKQQQSSSSSSPPAASFTKEAWFTAFQQLEENAKKCLKPEEAEKIKQDLETWRNRASKAVERVATLETDVNTLRFSNGVMKEQVASVLAFSEKMMMVLSASSANVPVPLEVQKIIQQREKNANNNSSNNNKDTPLRSQDFLNNTGIRAALRTVENVEEVSSSNRKVSILSSFSHQQQQQLHLGAFSFDDVKQMVERFDELSQALYVQEVRQSSSSSSSQSLVDQRKRHKIDDQNEDAAAGEFSSAEHKKSSSSSVVVTDDIGCQTEDSHDHHHHHQRVSHDGEDDTDVDSSSSSLSRGHNNNNSYTKTVSLETNADPQIFNALRQINLDIEAGYAATAQSESDLSQIRLATARQEIAALQSQLDTAQTSIKNLLQQKSQIEMREKLATETVEKLKSQLREQIAAEVQVPMLKEIPAILTRFEGVLSSISSHNQNETDEKSAKAIALDSLQHRLGGLEHLLSRLQSQYGAFDELCVKQQEQQRKNNNNNNNSPNNNIVSSSSSNSASNETSYDVLITSMKTRITDLETELESQGQDLENERKRTIDQLERMFQAEEQSRQLRNEMKELRATAISAQHAQELRDEISNLESRNSQITEQSAQELNTKQAELFEWKAKTASLQEKINEVNARCRNFEMERDQAIAQRNRASADLEAAGAQITNISRQLNDARQTVDTLTRENMQLQRDKESLKTSFLSKETVRDEFTRLFPSDSAGTEALSRLAHLDQELRSKSEEARSLARSKHELENNLATARDQLQAAESERLTSRMKTATTESALKRLQETSQKEIAALNNTVTYLKQDCQRLGVERDAAVERAQMLTQHVDVLSQDQLSSNARLYGLSETRSFTEQMKEIHTRNESLQRDLHQARTTVDERETQITIVQKDLNEECEKSAHLQKELNSANEVERTLRDNLASVEENLSSTVERLDTTQSQLHAMTHDRDEKQREIESHCETITSLENKVAELESEKEQLEEQIVRLKQAVEDSEELVAAARRAVESGGGGNNNNNSGNNSNNNNALSGSFSVGSNSNSRNIGRFTNAVSSS